jgi:alpha-L-fucosidase 2
MMPPRTLLTLLVSIAPASLLTVPAGAQNGPPPAAAQPAQPQPAPAPAPARPGLTSVITIPSNATQNGSPYVQTMDYYAAEGAGPHPAVILVHGGGFTSGTSRNGSEAYCADFLVPAGYAVFSINYRLAPGATVAEMLADVQRSIRFVRHDATKYRVDPDKIILLGGSAGGYLSNLAGVSKPSVGAGTAFPYQQESDKLAAVITLYGISDLAKMPDPSFVGRNELLGTAAPTEDDLAAASPLHHVHADTPPFLFIHGSRDPSVPLMQSVALQERLEAAGNRADLIVIPGGIHGTWTWHTLPGVPDWEREMVEWLNARVDWHGVANKGIEARAPAAQE